jgi:uncharacterized membrane protein YkvA (DUF1232 family)
MLRDKLGRYARAYSDSRFWKKIRVYSHKAGFEVLDKALRLYFVLQKPELPYWAKAAVIGALGYFIWPFDTLPDLAPIIGFTDDLTVIGAALATVALQVDEEIKERAHATAERWMGLGPEGEDEDSERRDSEDEIRGDDEV